MTVALSLLAAAFLAALPTASAEEEGELGLALDLGVASAYVWRGWNVFQDEGQMDPNMLLAPGVTWTLGDSGLYLGYWGAYQVSGPNRAAMVDAGLGAEQDLLVGYGMDLSKTLSCTLGLTGYVYPLADEALAGTKTPTYLEPAVAVSWDGPVTASLNLAYFHGMGTPLEGLRNVYVRPGIAWSHPMGEKAGLDLAGGVGYKLFTQADVTTNTLDLLVTAAIPITLGGSFYMKPSLNVAWTNIDGEAFVDGLAPWAGLNVGTEL